MLSDRNTELINEMDAKQSTSFWTPETMGEEHIHDLVVDLIPDQEIRDGRDMGLHIIDNSNPHADIARYVEWKVFLERFGNDLDVMEKEYGPYDKSSVFLLLLDYDKEQPVAVLRLMKPTDETGFKSINDLLNPNTQINHWYDPEDTEASLLQEIGTDDQSHTVDISTMAVMPDYRSAHARDAASAVLYSSCVRWSLENGYNYWVTIVDKRILTMIQTWGEPFLEFANKGLEPYLDSEDSKPMHLELYSGLKKVKVYDQSIYDLYTRGAGLQSSYLLPEFVLPDSL